MSSSSYDPRLTRRFGLTGEEEVGSAVEQLLEDVETQAEAEASLEIEGLEGKVAIVTGGSVGIGRAVSLALAHAGAHVAFTCTEDDPKSSRTARETADELESCGVRVYHAVVEGMNSGEVRGFVDRTVDRLGGVHILVNGAGVGRQAFVDEMSDGAWGLLLRTNLSGTANFIRAVAPLFETQEDGKVVNITLARGAPGELALANVSASRAGILALTHNAARELGKSNVNVNAVAPGAIRGTNASDEDGGFTEGGSTGSALGRLGDPQDVARVVLFLCSEAARHITGAVLPVDGGGLI